MSTNERAPVEHHLKIEPAYYRDVTANDWRFRKTAEVRRNDRDYRVGDMLVLEEYEEGAYTGWCARALVTHILREPWAPAGYVVMSIRLMSRS